MKVVSFAKSMFLSAFLFAVLPLCQVVQLLILGEATFSSGLVLFLEVQRSVIIGCSAALVLSLVAPNVFFPCLKKKTSVLLLLVSAAAFLVGLFLSTDLGLGILPGHWRSVSALMSSSLLGVAGFLWALLAGPGECGSRASRPLLLFVMLGYLSLLLLNRCSGGLLDSAGLLFWVIASFAIFVLLVCFWARECVSKVSSEVDGVASDGAALNCPVDVPGSTDEETSRRLEEKLEGYGFSDREAEALRLMAEGFTSDSSAELMGVKPATVRTYLQRAYKKMGVASAEESRALLLSSDATDGDASFGSDGPEYHEGALREDACKEEDSSWFSARFSRLVSLLSLVGLLLLVVPHEQLFVPESWYYSEIFTISIGFGLMVAGLGVLCFEGPLRLPWHRKLVGCLLLALLSLGTLWLIALPAFGTTLSSLTGYGLFLGILLCLVSVGLSLAALHFGILSQNARSGNCRAEKDVPLFLFAIVLGFVFEDTWRAATDDFTWWLQVAFLLVLLAYCFVSSKSRLLLGLCCAVLIVCAVGLGFGIRAIFVCLVSLSFVFFVWRGDGFESERGIGVALAGFGGSLTASRLLSDYWWDVMSQGAVSASIHGGQWLLGALMPAFELLLLLVGLASFYFLVLRVPALVDEDSWEGQGSSIPLYFKSRGLGTLETVTLSGIAQGKTSIQIAKESHYAVGSVNSARWSAYQKLGIHSKKELGELLRSNGFNV